MRSFLKFALAAALIATPVIAGQVLWDTQKGDVAFPGLSPTAIDNMVIGAVTPAAGTFTTATTTGLATAASIKVDTGTKTASATAGAATLNKNSGVITSESLTTAAGATYTLTITDSAVAAADQVYASVQNGTNSAGLPAVTTITPASGSLVVVVRNAHATDAFNGTIKVAYTVIKN